MEQIDIIHPFPADVVYKAVAMDQVPGVDKVNVGIIDPEIRTQIKDIRLQGNIK